MKTAYFLLLLPMLSIAQVTLKVTAIPANTPENAQIYFAGSANGWNPADPNFTLQSDGLGNRTIVIPEGIGTVTYKFTRGGWPTVEGNAIGGFLPDRTFTFNGAPQTINLTIQSWEDLGGASNSTAAANVQILNNAFFMPQLNTSRKIWLYLPPDYATSTKNYPVLYMQDGQNLFDNATSFSGEWQVDETLNTLFANGDYGAIVVGIDNGGGARLDEYSPWNNPQYGGGDGDDYMNFLANTLKPFIDANYRTRAEPAMNAMIGSSMGGLIATYGACEHPDAFRKVGSMSPAYWFALTDLVNYISSSTVNLSNQRMYFVGGTTESSTMVPNINTVKDNLVAKGLLPTNVFTKFDTYGQHNENYWKGEFGGLYQWLFAEENLAITIVKNSNLTISQTVSGKIFVEGMDTVSEFEIINMNGIIAGRLSLSNGIFELPEQLSSGIYILRSKNNAIKSIKLFKK